MKAVRRSVLLVPLALAAAELAAQTGNPLPKVSPFGGAAGPAATAAAAPEAIEFMGVSSIGRQTDLIFRNKAAKKSSWIGKGETKDGITVLNYDAEKEQAVVKIDGVQKVLSLKKSTTAVTIAGMTPQPAGFNMPAPAASAAAPTFATATSPAAPPANAAPPAPQTEIQRQETEARMLVSDLLEIGMAQRKAYEEAQRKAAEGGATPAPAAEPQPKQP